MHGGHTLWERKKSFSVEASSNALPVVIPTRAILLALAATLRHPGCFNDLRLRGRTEENASLDDPLSKSPADGGDGQGDICRAERFLCRTCLLALVVPLHFNFSSLSIFCPEHEMAGGLTEEQKADIDEAFALFAKGKPKLDLQGLGGFLRHMGQNLSNADLQQLGGMDRQAAQEFFARRFVVEETEADVLKSFEVFDRDGNGLISTVELRHVLTGLGERLDPEQVEDLLRGADQGDGMVNYGTFVSTMMANQKRY